MSRVITAVFFIMLASASNLLAHAGHHEESKRGPSNWVDLWTWWEFDPTVVVPLLVTGMLYCVGLARVWRKAGIGHGIRMWEAASFLTAWLSLVFALISPLHPLGSVLFSAHMTQHEILMLVSAPLLALSRPIVAMLHGVPPRWAHAIGRWMNYPPWKRFTSPLLHPINAWLIHAGTLWLWHIPTLFESTLTSDFMHGLQHTSFLITSLLLWWSVMHGDRRGLNLSVALISMFATALQSGGLGAILTFADQAWYPSYRETAISWGLTAVEDQQLGGAIMWIPACSIYVIAGLALAAGTLRSCSDRARQWEESLTRQVTQ